MVLVLWGLKTAAYSVLFLILIVLCRKRLPWFTFWVGLQVITNCAGFLVRDIGWLYDPVFRVSEVSGDVVFAVAAIELCRRMNRPGNWIEACLVGIPLSLFLRAAALRWPDSSLENVECACACLLTCTAIYLAPACFTAEFTERAVVAATFAGAQAACLFAASGFPHEIGIVTEVVGLLCALAWICVLLKEPGRIESLNGHRRA